MTGLNPALLAKPFSPGLLGAAQPPCSPGVGSLAAEGPHSILFCSWVQVLERALGMPDPAWNWAPSGPCCEFRLMSILLPAQLAAGRAANLAWIWCFLGEILSQSR